MSKDNEAPDFVVVTDEQLVEATNALLARMEGDGQDLSVDEYYINWCAHYILGKLAVRRPNMFVMDPDMIERLEGIVDRSLEGSPPNATGSSSIS